MPRLAPLFGLITATLLPAATRPVSRPATAPIEWGEPKAGLQTRITVDGEVAPGGKFLVRIALRNTSTTPIKLADAFAWLLLAQTRDKAFYTEKLSLPAEKGCPEQLDPDKTLELVIDLAPKQAYAMQKGQKVIDGYPATGGDAPAPILAGDVGQLTATGLRARCTLCIRAADGPVVLTSNPLTVAVAMPDFKTLSPQARQAYAAALVAQFRQDEYAAQQAHNRAVKIGPDILPPLLQAASDAEAPYFAKMWLTTALIDIGDVRAVDTLVKLLEAGDSSVRNVIAFHGPKLKSDKLSAAILARAQAAGGDPAFAAWAARGIAAGGGSIPDALIDASVKSPEPRARAEIAEVLTKKADEKSIARLVTLVADEHEGVRAAAAKAIAAANLRRPQLTGALVKSLDLEGDTARAAICACLVKLTGQPWPYDPETGPAGKATTIANWKQWWAKQK